MTNRILQAGLLTALLLPGHVPIAAADDTADELLNRARLAFREQEPDRAIELAGQAIKAAPDDARAHVLRGDLYAATGQHTQAVADYDRGIKLAPDLAELFDRRGSEQFKLGKIEESIADFDRFLALRPDQEPYHWKRGISYYYAGRYDDGTKQFESHQTVNSNDVENAVWRYLCMARSVGIEKARSEILPIKRDSRPVMMEVYALFRGQARPEDVLQAARQGDPAAERLNERLFYAELYLGLYYEAAGEAQKSAEHIAAALEHKVPHYMWDVAKVHADQRGDGKK
jgi:lipoprotein NlpI